MTPRQAIAQLLAQLEHEAALALARANAFEELGDKYLCGQENGYCDGIWTAIRMLEACIND